MPPQRRWPDERAGEGPVDVDRAHGAFKQLGVTYAAERLGELLSELVKKEVPAHRFLDQLLQAQIQQREEERVCTSLRPVGLPVRRWATSSSASSRASRRAG